MNIRRNDKEVLTEVGQKIREARKKNKITQIKLAKILGVSDSTIINYEKGRQSVPFSRIVDLCKALNTEPNDLLGYDVFIPVSEDMPDHLETVWLANLEKGWVRLGCMVDADDGYHWAYSNGVIYVEDGKIVSECESDDLDVTHFCRLPRLPI